MDEETRQAFAELLAMMNNQHERLLERIDALALAFRNTRGFLTKDGSEGKSQGRGGPC